MIVLQGMLRAREDLRLTRDCGRLQRMLIPTGVERPFSRNLSVYPSSQAKIVEEYISIRSPQGSTHTIRLDVRYDEDDEDIARRLSRTAEKGTVLTIAGSKYRIDGSEKVTVLNKRLHDEDDDDDQELKKLLKEASKEPVPQEVPSSKPSIERHPEVTNGVSVGQRWKSKDKRRDVVFTVAQVFSDHLVTEDGHNIKLDRIRRYELLA